MFGVSPVTVAPCLAAWNTADVNFRAAPVLILSASAAATDLDFYLSSIYAGCFLFSDQIRVLLSGPQKREL